MMYGADLAAGLTELRAAAESRMRDSCTVTRPGALTTDEDGNATQESTTVYTGRCYTRYPGLAFEQNRDSAGLAVVDSRIVVRVPFGVAFRPDDLVTITASPDNPQLVGTSLRVASIDDASQTTAQRLLCVDTQAGFVA